MLVKVIPFVIYLAVALGQNDRPIITTSGGQVQGTTESCGLFCTYYSFKGIPYAEPPTGARRFTNPVPHSGWSGVRDGSAHGSSCPTPDMNPAENEDCLFLNVYSPSLIGTRPVMVFVHGGAFSGGSGNVDLYNSRYFMPEDVVIVTVNYRLGVLGFFSTGDSSASGNWGIKDCVEALRWVQRNIVAFGGDPNNVTIFGQSAGGAMVHYLTLSPLTTGLFHRVIAQSGTALNSWALQPNPRLYANRLATAFGLSTTDTAALVAGLKQVPYRDLVALQEDLNALDVPLLLRPIDFSPVVEPADAPEPIALGRRPIDIIEDGSYNAIPMIAGFTDMDSLLFTAVEYAVNPTMFNTFNNNPHFLVPFFWNIAQGSPESTAVSQAFQQYYWQGQQLSSALLTEFSVFVTDHQFAYGVLEMARRHALRSSVYVYQFSYDGDLNLVKQSFGIPYPGALHADELCYLFHPEDLTVGEVPQTSHAITVRNRMLRLWTNFAKYGNPTPTVDPILQNMLWTPISGGTINAAVNIGQNLVPGANPIAARYNQWQELEARYANNVFRV
ncbi:juvenile hormone esterase-like [Anopheles ziemanni]|uniref:juvenile hormone esterase-like n=1 Tax=Anopheles coustani TaxID=139045 RepID=UPI00265AA4C1|nr:juvenile hormone esterase-like [Anopheles coustani]XP_058174274.1 juvenile hormone esterase-like [Anopheles ziemanni]